MRTILFSILLNMVLGCVSSQGPINTDDSSANLMRSGDIVVVNNASDAVLLLNPDGSFKATLIDYPQDTAYKFDALTWDPVNKQLLITYDHTTNTFDKVLAVSPYDLSVSTYLATTQLAGTNLAGIGRMANNDLVVLEGTSTVEKFYLDKSRFAGVNAWINAALSATVVDLEPLQDGNMIICSSNTTTNSARIYSNTTGAALYSQALSTTPGTSLGGAYAASGCVQLPNGNIAVVFNGANDGVRVFDSTLATWYWNFLDATNLSNPGKIAVRANGNLLIPDVTLGHIVEITDNGSYVGTLGGSVLNGPTSILVVP